ncbi:probable DUR3 - Urea permease [Melanopsichium pennsylvanicum]|uniref:Probable DUR3 - Urea permease n=2 Tax=Melanopsichium pennsylvanicum TaxID=63383 RepID=A0AAJ5C544_9BASI|nr:probable DUR3-Urea permease [Melanopsichium pennsylvanicum 4]SNX84345.1 probable DUR3 - Urea permease [Melanopsichium pennsylvanicum]
MAVPPLSQGVGYGVVIGLGALFAIVVVGISRSLVRYAGISKDAEEFSVARRSLGTGLIAAAVISSWTWSTTLLSSVSTAYNYGVAGAMLYASGNCTQIVLFSTLAIQLKRRAPSVHTYLELVRIRFGTLPHLTYIFFALATNILVCSSVLLGGAAAVNAITGMNVYAALFLLPTSVVAYTLRGGLRSTILADYLHTVIIFIILFVFWLRAYATFPEIGSPAAMYDLLIKAQKGVDIAGNYKGSLLTLKTEGGQYFAWLSALEYTGVVFLDASFHQKGVAAMPEAAFPGYLIGGLAWFSIPFCLATTAGLAALALETTYPGFPTYPNRIPQADVSAGLVLPYAAQALLGKGGSAAVLLLMFMSCTSAISAQMVGVSTVVSYDIFKTYFKPTVSVDKLLHVNQYVVVGFGLFAAAFGSLLHGIGLDLGIIYNLTGIFTGAGLSPLIFIFFDTRLHPAVVFPGIWFNFLSGVTVWLTVAWHKYGVVNLGSVGGVIPCLAGCGTGIGVGLVLSTISVLFFPREFGWDKIPEILEQQHKEQVERTAKHQLRLHLHRHEQQQGGENPPSSSDEKPSSITSADPDPRTQLEIIENDPSYNRAHLDRSFRIAIISALTIFVVITIIWPFSLYRDYIFTRTFFQGWVIVSFIWAIFAFVGVGIFPAIQGIPVAKVIIKNLKNKVTGSEVEVIREERRGSEGTTTTTATSEKVGETPAEIKQKHLQTQNDSAYIA